jgi:hypothetical protein
MQRAARRGAAAAAAVKPGGSTNDGEDSDVPLCCIHYMSVMTEIIKS